METYEYGSKEFREDEIKKREITKKILYSALAEALREKNYEFADTIIERISTQNSCIRWEQEQLDKIIKGE